jgi:plastocyanin
MVRALVGGLVLAVVLSSPAPAARSVVHSSGFQFVPPTVVVDRGGTLTYTNADIAPHNVVALDKASAIWDGDLFIAEFGNFFGDGVVGHQVVRVPIDANGKAGAPQTFLPGVAPLDLAFGPPGTGLYIGDFATGQILLVKG